MPVAIGHVASPSRKRALRIECPLCSFAFAQDEIEVHAAECHGKNKAVPGGSSASGSPAGPHGRRRRKVQRRVTVQSLALRLTQQLNHSEIVDIVDTEASPPAKVRCPVCAGWFPRGTIAEHAALCDGAKIGRESTIKRFIAADLPLRAIVNFDSAVSFVRKLHHIVLFRGEHPQWPQLVYHWTAEGNTNFLAPQHGSQVAHGSKYGRGVYVSKGFHTTRFYGHGASRAILCLASFGRVYDNDTQGHKSVQQTGYDSACFWNRTGGVLFSSDQVLPCFLVSEKDYQRAEDCITSMLENLMCNIRLCSDDKSGGQQAQPYRKSWLRWLLTLVGF